MAKVTYTGIVESINGSIGGLTFQKNSSGDIVRLRPRSSKSSTYDQQLKQSIHVNLLHLYTALSDANKILWDAFAVSYPKTDKWGNSKILTGQQWFLSINYYQLLINSTTLSEPPAYAVPDAIDGLNVLLSYESIILDFTNDKVTTDTNIMIFATQPIVGSIRNSRPYFKYLTTCDFSELGTLDITDLWKAKFGLDWPVNSDELNFSIGAMAYTVNNVSGWAGAGITNYSQIQFGVYGIGAMEIGNTFYVM
jgi:hypothetical protein